MHSDRHSSPLIAGREQEQARLRELLDDALGGRGNLVLISGEAGIGKTTLVEDLARQARERGLLVLPGHCYDLTATRPYAPWFEVLTAYQDTDEASRVPPTFSASEADAMHGQGALLERAAEFFTAIARDQPMLITFEDMHWSDQASLEALRYLARQVVGIPLLIVVTYRDDELDEDRPLYRLLPVLIREARAERLDLRRLDEGAMRAWMSRRYPLSPSDHERLVSHLQANSEGNPFFAVELLRTLESEGVVRPTLAGWAVGELGSLGVPMLLRQVIDARIAMLGDGVRDLLAVAAVVGHQVSLDIWGAVAGVDDERLVDLIEMAVRANLLVADSDGRSVRFTHALIRAALYEAILPPRRRVWHRRIGDALLDGGETDPDLIAHHLQQAGDPRAPNWLVRAADRAYYAYAFSAAIERYEAALGLVDQEDLDPAEHGWMLLHLAQSYRYTDARLALNHAARAETIAAKVRDPVLIALTAWSRGQIRGLLGENSLADLRAAYSELVSLSEQEWERIREIERLSHDTLTSAITRWLALYGRYDEAVEVGEGYLAAAPESDEVWAGLGFAYAALGRPEDAEQAFRRAFDYYQRNAIRQLAQVMAFTNLTWVTLIYQPDQIEERRRVAREAQDVWTRSASIRLDLEPRAVRAPLLLIEGRWDEVQQYAAQMISPAFPTSGLSWLGQIARWRGEWDLAWKYVYDVLPGGPTGDPAVDGRPAFISMTVLLNLAANLALDQGDLHLAQPWIEMHSRWLNWSGAVVGRAENQLLWARYHRACGDAEPARQHARNALDSASDPRQPLALLAAHRMIGELDTDARRYASAADHINRSLTLASDCAAPYERALTLLAQANLLVALAKPDEARTALADVRAICEPLGAQPALEHLRLLEERLVSRPRGGGHVAGLSARELEVLRLLAQGLTDAQIGERLFISPRTVSQHLRSVYNKLGINSRAAAVAFIFEQELL